MPFDIVNRFSGAVMYHSDITTTLEDTIKEAISSGANLRGAYLSRAYLSGANLSGAYLSGANLHGANLSRANLHGAYLHGAYLSGAHLHGAYLSRANLSGAYLSGANLSGAYLSGADLHGAYLSGADLHGAYLSRADLGDLKILQIAGSQHFIIALSSPDVIEVRVGCCHYPLTHWLEHYKAIGRSNGYTESQIIEYGLHLGYVEQWAKTITWPAK